MCFVCVIAGHKARSLVRFSLPLWVVAKGEQQVALFNKTTLFYHEEALDSGSITSRVAYTCLWRDRSRVVKVACVFVDRQVLGDILIAVIVLQDVGL